MKVPYFFHEKVPVVLWEGPRSYDKTTMVDHNCWVLPLHCQCGDDFVTSIMYNQNKTIIKALLDLLAESGFYVISLGCLSVRPSVHLSVHQSSVTCHYQIFVKNFMKLGVNELKKVTQPEFWKKLNPRIRGLSVKNQVFDVVSETLL